MRAAHNQTHPELIKNIHRFWEVGASAHQATKELNVSHATVQKYYWQFDWAVKHPGDIEVFGHFTMPQLKAMARLAVERKISIRDLLHKIIWVIDKDNLYESVLADTKELR